MVKLETVWSALGWFSKPFFVKFLSVKEPPGGDAVDDDLSWAGAELGRAASNSGNDG